jgi:hypothetical protein
MGANNLINVTPLLSLAEAQASLAEAAAYARAYNGSVVIETLPTWYGIRSNRVLWLTSILQEHVLRQGNVNSASARSQFTFVASQYVPAAQSVRAQEIDWVPGF